MGGGDDGSNNAELSGDERMQQRLQRRNDNDARYFRTSAQDFIHVRSTLTPQWWLQCSTCMHEHARAHAELHVLKKVSCKRLASDRKPQPRLVHRLRCVDRLWRRRKAQAWLIPKPMLSLGVDELREGHRICVVDKPVHELHEL